MPPPRTPGGNWPDEWPSHVLAELTRLGETIQETRRDMQEMRREIREDSAQQTERSAKDFERLRAQAREQDIKIAKLEVKAGVWGGAAGLVTAVASVLLSMAGIDDTKSAKAANSKGYEPTPAASVRSYPTSMDPRSPYSPRPERSLPERIDRPSALAPREPERKP